MMTGFIQPGRPSLGAWTVYGLGTENADFPAFVVLLDKMGGPLGGAQNWNSGYVPASFQGTAFRNRGQPIGDLASPKYVEPEHQSSRLDFIKQLNQIHLQENAGDLELAARIEAYELGYRMQSHGRKLWTSPRKAAVDKPIRGLLKDLKGRGLLDSTLVVWHTEFGRLSISQSIRGRDHGPNRFTVWMAGGRAKGDRVIGATDEFGYQAAMEPHSVNDLHVTILHMLGLDHTRLTYFYNGRPQRLTEVSGEVIQGLSG